MEDPGRMAPLPDSAHVVSGPGVWLEGAAVAQLARVARLPGCVRAVGLPDLHAGPGIPIGAALAFRGQVRPLLVGGDAGCGVRMVVLPRLKWRGDALERRVRDAVGGPPLPDLDARAALAAVWHGGPRALADVAGVPDDLAALLKLETAQEALPVPVPDGAFGAAIGTVGGGNHFLELSEVGEVFDANAAGTVGLKRRGAVVLAHSGSRGLGRWLVDRWGDAALDGTDAATYLAELRGAVRFARANRLVLTWRMLRAAGAARPGRIAGVLDIVHNDVQQVDLDGPAWLHRKGAAPAAAGALTVVLGTRGTPSMVMEGTGAVDCLCSVAHGAGRRMGRSEALQKLKSRVPRASAARHGGGRVICADKTLLFTEHPHAYKDIAPVIDATVAAGAARRVAALHPRITVKQ